MEGNRIGGIAAKDLDSTYYVAAVYESGGVRYSTGVLAYSVGAFCASNGSALAQAIAVYGSYAKAYFGEGGKQVNKTYSKPDIAFESFALATSIANCEVKTDTKGGGECGYPMAGLGVIFIVGMNLCDVPITDEQSLQYNGFCYHVPMENRNLFNS